MSPTLTLALSLALTTPAQAQEDFSTTEEPLTPLEAAEAKYRNAELLVQITKLLCMTAEQAYTLALLNENEEERKRARSVALRNALKEGENLLKFRTQLWEAELRLIELGGLQEASCEVRPSRWEEVLHLPDEFRACFDPEHD